MEYTLKMLKDALYTGERPALYKRVKSVTEEEFLKTFFPEDFYTGTFIDENGKVLTLSTVLTRRNKNNTSQRNKVFTGRYTGLVLEDNVPEILQTKPTFLKKICANCETEIEKAADHRELRKLIESINSREIKKTNFDYYNFVWLSMENELRLAFAAVVLYLLMQGKVDDLLPVLNGSSLFSGQFEYMEQTIPLLKRTFGIRSAEDDFSSVLEHYYDPFASLLSFVSTVNKAGDKTTYSHLLNFLYDAILDAKGSDNQKIIKIRGASGSDKNAVTQLLYLKLANEVRSGYEDDYAPHYVNLNHYSNERFQSVEIARNRLTQDAEPFLKYCELHPNRIPILFVDGVKRYDFGDYNLDYYLNNTFGRLRTAKYVVAIEDGSVINSKRQRDPAAFASGRFGYTVRMEPLYLPSSEEAIKYLNAFTKIYGGNDPEEIYRHLRRMGFNRIDTYQLRMCLGRDFDLIARADNLAHLYHLICNEKLTGEQDVLTQGEQWAFDFAYTSEPLPDVPSELKRLLSAHDSVQEYFIARWYLSRIREEALDANQLNMVMPKGVTRFVVPMLNRSVEDESRVLSLIEREYAGMGLMAQSEMTYWLGRIKAQSLSERAERMLLRYYEDQKEKIKGISPAGEKYRNCLFLLRGISVSLIVKGRVDISEEYITSLVQNDAANEINRGFHLEYYGDKPYLPVYDTLTFLDDITSGKRTLDQLITANEQSISTGNLPHIFDLNLFTICSLLQARIEIPNPDITFDLEAYLEKACRQIEWYLKHNRKSFPIFREYLLMVNRDFQKRLIADSNNWNTIAADSYSTYSRRIYRTGWVDRGVKEPETDSEHMYHTWLLAMMFLPKESPDIAGYSKEKILNLLLIHDIAEVITGDIPRPKKSENPEHYRNWESDEMGIYLLRGSYPGMANIPEYYEVWQMWYDKDNINGCIAREVDVIQTMFQLLTYAVEQPECFEDEDLRRWMRDRYEIRTAPGISILQSVILKNQRFQEILTRLQVIGNHN